MSNNNYQLLCIVGPTGTGKTARAIEEAKKTPTVIISADSRQVYRGMDIVTGKDHPAGVKICGIDLVDPDQPCSVSVWYDAVRPVIDQALGERKQIIIVGGTGLYVRAVTHGIATMSAPLNPALRSKLESLSLSALQSKLQFLDADKFSLMNHSDQMNPRRLIRAIEVASSVDVPPESRTWNLKLKTIGLHYSDPAKYQAVIRERVLSRLAAGAVAETQKLLAEYGPDHQSFSAVGYRSIMAYISGKISEPEMIKQWVGDELKYSKRQLTWFRKDKSIEWYDKE